MPQIKLVVWDLDNTLWNGTTYGYKFTEKLPDFHPWLKIERR